MWDGVDGSGWWMLWGGMVALIVWGVQALTRREGGHTEPRQTSPSGRPPLDIAKERYARGDLARDEFEQIKKDLEGS